MRADAAARIRGRGYKATPQRLAVLRALAEKPRQSLGELRGRCEGVGTVTVYRTVELLLELGIARRVDFGGGSRYELAGEHRHHFICEPCGGVFDLGEQAPGIERFLLRVVGPKIGLIRIDVYGRCRGRCAARG